MMEIDKDVHDILETLKYTTADSLKAIQRKFSAARNTLIDDALSHQHRNFFTPEEQEALQAASRILGSFKSKIEHAKEIRAREEKQREALLNRCKSQRIKLLDACLSRPTSLEQHVESVVFHLALQDQCGSIAKGAYFGHGMGHIETDLERGLDTKYPHIRVRNVATTCRQESHRWLEENLWRRNVEPEPSRLEKVMEIYRNEWRYATLQQYKNFLDRFASSLADELERDAASGRAKEAVRRRANIKVVE